MRPKTIGLIAHTGKKAVADLVRMVAEEFRKRQVSVLIESETAALAGLPGQGSVADLARSVDLLVVLGGDGTILRATAQIAAVMKPIFGINVGSLGFLTCATSADYREAVAAVADDKIILSERTLLDVQVRDAGGAVVSRTSALNDAVLSRGEISRLIRLRTRVDGEELTEFNADGLVVATATGSTAYSLSAGGPILAPESGVLVITPICPHVLTNRSIIVSENSRIEIGPASSDYPVFLTVDGREPSRVEPGGLVAITKAEQSLPLAMMPGVSFFNVVRQKLKWSGSNI